MQKKYQSHDVTSLQIYLELTYIPGLALAEALISEVYNPDVCVAWQHVLATRG